MKLFTPTKLALAISAQLALTAGVAPLASAQNDVGLEEVVVTGTRRAARSVFDSAAPIDVISGDDFRNQGGNDMTDLIRNVVPSYNVNAQPISDAATVIRPANMRGLAPDHTLVLVNGKRRHRASVITWLGNGVSDGAQGPDISPIPAIALKQVEILRDGASAQYGSDAIAGVMNFILKDAAEGGTIEVKYGEFSEDNENIYSIAGNIGLPITNNGFFNASFEYGESDNTDRSIQRDDAAALTAAGNTAVANPSQVWGSPEVSDDIKTIFNMAVDVGNNAEVYGFGNYAYKEVEGGFFFRNPDTRGGVFSNDGDDNRLVGDITGDMSGDCPVVPVGDEEALQSIIDDPDCFVFNGQFPGGFTPTFGGDVKDASMVAGFRGNMNNGVNYDISAGFGWNDADFFINNTVNSSLGPASPTSFDPGDYTQTEYNFNADFGYGWDVGLFASELNVAGGFEMRSEEFEMTAGETDSWDFGPLADQGFSAASNGFSGFNPDSAGDWDRTNTAVYLDLETDVTENWLLGVAVRYEDYDDFGSTTNGKISTHYSITDWLGIRGTYSTGFRAPTPGQQNATNTSTSFSAAVGDLVNEGVIPPSSAVAQLSGGKELKEETSDNYTAGVVLQWERFSVTADWYKIELDDRIALSKNFILTDEDKEDLIAAGVSGAGNISEYRFFVNGLETTTEGVDVVATYSTDWSLGVTDFNLAWNYNKTDVDSPVGPDELIDKERQLELENGLPENRVNASMTHLMDSWRFTLRSNWTDEWYDTEDKLNNDTIVGRTYDSYWTADIEVGYSFDNGLTVMAGGQNFTDETPDRNPLGGDPDVGLGRKYSQYSPLGFNGAFWYGRVSYDF
jgi:iron complex outermembrane receptor protein